MDEEEQRLKGKSFADSAKPVIEDYLIGNASNLSAVNTSMGQGIVSQISNYVANVGLGGTISPSQKPYVTNTHKYGNGPIIKETTEDKINGILIKIESLDNQTSLLRKEVRSLVFEMKQEKHNRRTLNKK